MLDVAIVNHTFGNHPDRLPVVVEGLNVRAPSQTLCSQATGAGACVLVIALAFGVLALLDRSQEFRSSEVTVVSENGRLVDGEAEWFTCVALQHAPAGAISRIFVSGGIAVVASAIKATDATILAAVGSASAYVILGDVRFHRDGDLSISVLTTDERRPRWVDTTKKTSFELDQATPADMGKRFWGYIDLPLDLASVSTIAAGALAFDGFPLPPLPYGGEIGDFTYVQGEAGAGVAASLVFRLGVDGAECTGNDLTLLLATTALSVAPVTASTAFTGDTNKFEPGATLDLELQTKTTAFTGGTGILKVGIWEYVS